MIFSEPTAHLISPVTSNESSSPGLTHNSTPHDNTHSAAVPAIPGSSRESATVAASQALQEASNTPSNSDQVQPQVSPDAFRGAINESRIVATSARSPRSEEIPQLQTAATITSTQNRVHELSSEQPSDQNIDNRAPSAPLTTRNSEISPTMQPNVNQISCSHAQSPRRRVLPPAMPSLKPRIELIKRHIEYSGGTASLSFTLEQPRFNLLEKACDIEDTFYVALHQLFCVWDTARQDITGIPGLPDSGTLNVAFGILGQLIRSNNDIAPTHLRWFANFPSPLVGLVKHSESYRRFIREVGRFLRRLASHWPILNRACESRGHPPLIDELINSIGVLSFILQNVIFTAIRRNLNIVDDEFGRQMEIVFEEDRSGHRELASRYNTSFPPSEREIEERNKKIIDNYMIIAQRLRQMQHANVASQPSTIASAPSSSTSETGRDQMAANGSHPYSNLSMFTPNQSAPRQQNDLPNRQIGRNLGQIRTSFPAPTSWMISAGGNHPNTIPRTGANSPNPIPIQDLSVNSPMRQGFQFLPPVSQSNGHPFQSPTIRNNGTQSPVMVQPQGSPQGQHNHDSRFDPRQQTCYHHPSQQQQFGQQGQYATNVLLQMNSQQNQHVQMIQQRQAYMQRQQQQQQEWFQQGMLSGHHNNQRQMPQQAQALAMHHNPQLRREITSVNGQQQQQQILSRNGSRHSSRNNSVSSDHVLTPMNGPAIYPQNSHQGFQGPAHPRSMTDEERCTHYRMSDPMKRPIIPPQGFIYSPGIPDPNSNALHQAHIRSPRLIVANISEPGDDDVSRRFYQFVKQFPLAPTKIPFQLVFKKFEFQIPADVLALIPHNTSIGTDPSQIREVRSKSLQFRLKCVSAALNTDEIPISSWVVSDTVWPNMIFMDINSKDQAQNTLDVRRKKHYGKDLPVDLTPYIQAGKNEIAISIPRRTDTIKEKEYFIAVEEVEILNHNEIVDLCREQSISAATVVEDIKKKLARPVEEDDDLLIVASDLSIDLTDPFTARIFEIPVRGKDCLHRECFDLPTFLLTRVSKPKRPEQPSMIDVWKCPLCGLDARPYNLQCDQFLVSVREELQEQDNLDVKSILVAADGSWRPKPESQSRNKRKSTTGLDDDGIDGDRPCKKPTNGDKAVLVEVIDLDDD